MIGPTDAVTTREMSIAEINAGLPRSVEMSADGQTAVVLVLIVFLILSLFLAWVSYLEVRAVHKADILQRYGQETTGRVTRIWRSRGRGSNTYVDYSFSYGGTTFSGEVIPSDFQRIRVHVGDQLPIRFLPSDPSVNRPTGWGWVTFGDVILLALALLFFGMGLRLGVLVYLRWKLGRLGWVTEGMVIACAAKGERFRVDYQFLDENQTLFDGANEYSYDEYKYGSKIRVIYMRSNPKNNDTYPLNDFPMVGS